MTTDAEELVRRYLALWQEYLTALLAEPATAALPQVWAGLWSGLLSERRDPAADERDGVARSPGSPAGAAAAAGAYGERDRLMAELAGRLQRLEERVAALERGRRAASRPRGGVGGSRS